LAENSTLPLDQPHSRNLIFGRPLEQPLSWTGRRGNEGCLPGDEIEARGFEECGLIFELLPEAGQLRERGFKVIGGKVFSDLSEGRLGMGSLNPGEEGFETA
jgi:hypothetical protein